MYRFEIDQQTFTIHTVPGSGTCKVLNAQLEIIGFYTPDLSRWSDRKEAFHNPGVAECVERIELVARHISRHRLVANAVFGSGAARDALRRLPALAPLPESVRIYFECYEKTDGLESVLVRRTRERIEYAGGVCFSPGEEWTIRRKSAPAPRSADAH